MTQPTNSAPNGMGGATRMYDPTEAEHDRARRRVMNIAFVFILLVNGGQWYLVGLHGRQWISVLLLIIAAIPLGLGVKVFELRFKMATEERNRALGELPRRKRFECAAYTALIVTVCYLQAWLATWALCGVWFYDFYTYYHDRPERMRHLYAITKTLDELREFPLPWAWALPALVWTLWRM